jgi:Mg-chelatase subunit ChlD
VTQDDADVLELLGVAAPDPQVTEYVRQIVAGLMIPRPRRDSPSSSRSGEWFSTPYRGSVDEIDMDRTLEVLAERRPLMSSDVIVRERKRSPRLVVLAVDVSGSMRGERVRVAAATVGALASALHSHELAVLAFWSDAAWLAGFDEAVEPYALLTRMLSIPAKGLTNIGFPLDVAADALRNFQGGDRRVLLLSDCVHNAGPSPLTIAPALPRLDVLVDISGENDPDLGKALAQSGRGRNVIVRSHRDVARGINQVFAP